MSALFLRFLKFGAMAWGGPMAQIAMLRRSLVEEQHWVSSEHFNRILALYQVLPGPEAHEMCVYFGTLARGRIGGLLAGLGFMLPGFLLILVLSWAYFHLGLDLRGNLSLLFAAAQAAVIALIVRAVHRIGSHVLLNPWLWGIGVGSFLGQLMGVHFAVLLTCGGLIYFIQRFNPTLTVVLLVLCFAGLVGSYGIYGLFDSSPLTQPVVVDALGSEALRQASLAALFWSGLKAGLLTFGGAYTVIPFLQRDAVSQGAWMSNAQFMDGIALSGLLPAPLIIFSTFVGYAGGGLAGAIVMTVAIFLPAFVLPILIHEPLDRLLHDTRIRDFLDGITAAVVGLIAGTAVALLMAAVKDAYTAAVFLVSAGLLFYSNHRLIVPLVIAGAAVVGAFAMAVT
ncbi:chromate efflux transporter [Steroidobacter sp. S1-65]|uniref:Chromate efflux transporter n=1 Tax=Steroidobacter gossypii TaxID=2805490 RepID=A0ABS1WW31_9GAMM|nr:chromate efflux transporter [Steroidobacter gossypii]